MIILFLPVLSTPWLKNIRLENKYPHLKPSFSLWVCGRALENTNHKEGRQASLAGMPTRRPPGGSAEDSFFTLKRSPLNPPSTRVQGSSPDHSGHTGMWDTWTLHGLSEKHKERKPESKVSWRRRELGEDIEEVDRCRLYGFYRLWLRIWILF